LPSEYQVLQLIHVIGATIWVGGHLLLLGGYLRRALREGSASPIIEFERMFARIGLPSFALTMVSGALMGLIRYPPSLWLDLDGPTGRLGLKVLTVTALLPIMVYAEKRVLPALKSGGNPKMLARFSVLATVATILSLILVVLGWAVRFGI